MHVHMKRILLGQDLMSKWQDVDEQSFSLLSNEYGGVTINATTCDVA